jgi:hypothetical protein
MTAKLSPLAVVVKREMKQAHLERFIAEQLARPTPASGDQPQRRRLRLLARSLESPVVKALIALGASLAEGDIEVEAIVAMPPARAEAEVVLDGLPFTMTLRRAANPRLLDAHEQLLLGPVTTWIGDSMRRDPVQRDAYETFADDCMVTAGFARVAFDRLSVHTIDFLPTPRAPGSAADEAAMVSTLAGLPEAARPTGAIAGTRH